jgi:murein DD-endopeptidase MepM/ murein hydrolase activator NlpD
VAYLFPVAVNAGLVTQLFGPRIHPVSGKPQNHGGMDIGVPVGTPIVAMAAGTVIAATWDNGGGGYYVKVQHDDGRVSAYLHLTTFVVKKGQRVGKGEVIAYSGNTGTSTGPHLHVEVRSPAGDKLNPLSFWSGKFPAKRENIGDDYVYGTANQMAKIIGAAVVSYLAYRWLKKSKHRNLLPASLRS